MDNGFIAKFRFPDLDFVINNYTIRDCKISIEIASFLAMTLRIYVIASGKTPLERAPQKEMTIKISNWLFSLISLFYNLLNFVKFYTV